MIEREVTPQDDTQARVWSQQLQRRIMRLLLLYDERLFHHQFHLFFADSQLPAIPLLLHYDRYVKLRTLSNTLLDDIMPRIRRQLSMKTSHARLLEEGPTRGNIDWSRTLERSWHTSPGLPALQFETRLRQRSMETPENLLTVALLLAYRQELHAALQEIFDDEALSTQERQFLITLDERAERELAAPYARLLAQQAQQVQIAALVQQVQAHLRPGASPYRDLLSWWQHFMRFRIGRADEEMAFALASNRSDEKSDAWLYELWIALEFLHLLTQTGDVQSQDIRIASDLLQYTFNWQGRRFRFLYNRQLDTMTSFTSAWQNGPASRPDYTIEREDPLTVIHDDVLIWREPAVVMDAKYYLGGDDPTNTHGPLKKLLGDLTLLEAHTGVLFFPTLPEPEGTAQITRTLRRAEQRYAPQGEVSQQVHLVRLTPDLDVTLLQQRLQAILDLATAQLPERPTPVCQGVWLDADSVNASASTVPARKILCPKRHISDGAFDVVDAESDCLKNPLVCHVMGQAIVRPEVIRVTSKNALIEKSIDIRTRGGKQLQAAEASGDEQQAERVREQVFSSIGGAVEQLAALRGDTKAIEDTFNKWIFKGYWKEGPRHLAPETRNMLLSGEYVWHEYESSTLDDWAAPAIQYCRALEFEVKRRLYKHHARDFRLSNAGWTLGTLKHLYHHRHSRYGDTAHNWQILETILARSDCQLTAFYGILERIANEQVIEQRNHLAHGDPIKKEVAEALRDAVLGDSGTNGILSWFARNIEPASASIR